ncbi:DUF2569 domain-containing protein [Wenzhouxiangella sp. EGI_FJ10409]|uniref:DUF2569 domain-containing protein n=1 Tax=Wenzhouxiangella sp. EGI_FJ10409 TaxID=3243767 RepID=UPI0035D99391
MQENRGPEGLGGWLILVGIGIVVGPFRMAFIMLETYRELGANGTWEILTTQGSGFYYPELAALIVVEMVVNLAILAASVYVAYLFFTKRRSLPAWYIGVAVFSLVFVLVDAIVVSAMLPDMPLLDSETAREMGRSLIQVCVWVPYMLVSKRVKNTFVNGPGGSGEVRLEQDRADVVEPAAPARSGGAVSPADSGR